MYRYLLTVFVILSIAIAAQATPGDEIADILTRAESLYFEAKFRDAIQVLQRADEMLKPQANRVSDKIAVKLQLALAHIGLNETAQAKARLRELFALDAEYRLDAQQFPPKVLALADEARAEQSELRCQAVRADARKYLETGNGMAFLSLTQAMKGKCTGLEAMEPEAAELLYKAGVDAYKAGQFSDALEKFRWALNLAPKHELAAQYVELTQGKLQVNADRQVLEWRKSVEAHEFKQAAVRYGQIAGSKDAPAPQTLAQMRSDYRNAVTAQLDSWNRSCAAGDTAAMDSIRGQLPEHFSDASMGEDLLAQMQSCVKKACMPVTTQLALARLKVQVNPVVPPAFQVMVRGSQVTIHVKTRIDEKGDVTVIDSQGGNSALNDSVRVAVERWKFAPIMDTKGPRCAETDIPIVIKP
jgi:tetratricopeptide (TPR) repeat protein